MSDFAVLQLSSLEKVFWDYKAPKKEFKRISVLKNEKFSYQLAYKVTQTFLISPLTIEVDSPLKDLITVRLVGNVPVEMPVYRGADKHYDRLSPGLYPDVLYPIKDRKMTVGSVDNWHSLWVTVCLDGNVPAGKYPVTISLIFGSEAETAVTVKKTLQVEIIDALLPEQELKFTQWFHTDCIADYYRLPVFSEEHWTLVDKFVKMAADNGINMILTPIFTPPLDTEVGNERPTVQLIDVEKTGNTYRFCFEKLRRWIHMCQKNGIRYFEMAHLFTQWGLKCTPKIVATENGVQKRIFGWDVAADDPSYMNFLSQMLPQLSRVLDEEGISQNTYFHISDEPHTEHIERYKKLKAEVSKLLPGYIFMDALSNYAFYSEGAVDCPIPASNAIEPFIENHVPGLWTYYCCGQWMDVSNRFIAMPSYRNRVIGLQFYKFDIEGFLQWGYNFYNSALSRMHIDPFRTTDGFGAYPAGDPFSVYPGEDGPLESLRILVFYDALQDLRALKLLESYIGKEKVVGIIEDMAGMEIRFNQYPHRKDFLLKLRERINTEIKKFAKA